MTLAPIILFTYNRPWHTEQTLNALMQNEFADKSTLYIYCDGIKKNAYKEDIESIKEVRNIVRKSNWCKEVIIFERDENLGLANSIIRGVTEILKKHGKIIVLEDDMITGKHFLEFMNNGLECYKDEDKVYGISGYCFPSSKIIKDDTFFLPIMSSWGYGTWAKSWAKINFNGQKLLNEVHSRGIESKINFGRLNYYQMLKDQVSGKIDSWAVRFYVSMFLDNGVFLYPNKSLLQNIGLDGTGIHCNAEDSKIYNDSFQKDINIEVAKKDVSLNPKNVELIKNNCLNIRATWRERTKKGIKKIVAPELIQLVKRKTGFKKSIREQKFAQLPRYTKTSFLIEGKEIIVADNASFIFMYKEIFEDHIYKFRTSKKEPYIIDGGANIGLATIYLKKLYPFSKIVAFEPDSYIFEMLKTNINAFNFKDVELVQKGLWSKNTTLSFQSEGADGGLITDVDKMALPTDSIEVVSLKPYLNKTVDFLKLDIEGSETTVLQDIEKLLLNVDRIFVEYHSFVGQPQTLNKVINILHNASFRLYISSPGLSNKVPFINLNVYNNMDMQLNIYGLKEN